jgi:hypothetical protein
MLVLHRIAPQDEHRNVDRFAAKARDAVEADVIRTPT